MDKDVVYIYMYMHTYTHTYIHNGILLSHKKNEVMPFATIWTDLEINILNEINQTENGRYHMTSLIGGI